MNDLPDLRLIDNGRVIPSLYYADQPYLVRTADGAWLCCLTTGCGAEGTAEQLVTTQRSSDQGRTWSAPVPVEPAGGPENSYAVLLAAPNGRIFIFYNHNTDNLRAVLADDPPFAGGLCRRVDSLGYFVFRYSDDGGHSWSAQRYPIPVRAFEIDRRNPYGGEVRFFWNVGKPFILGGAAYVSLHKVGGFGEGFFTSSEGVLLRSADLLTCPDPAAVNWETLPEGEIGLRAPAGGGPVAEEQSYAVLGDGSLAVVYRTIDGHPACSYSRDGGRSWEPPRYLRYADGRLVKHPRAANFMWRCANGKYLYWFHNHGGRFIREHPRRRTFAYEDRNPAWLCGGVEVPGANGMELAWSQPEVALYDDDPYVRISYPDLLEERGEYYLSETQKAVARVHPVDIALLEGLWGQFAPPAAVSREGLLLELPLAESAAERTVTMPALPEFTRRDNSRADYGEFSTRAGFSLALWIDAARTQPGAILLDNRDGQGRGLCLGVAVEGTLELRLCDGRTCASWASDPGTLAAGGLQHAVVIVDGGPRLILYVLDGRLQDGGESRPFGWGRFSPHLRGANGAEILRATPALRALRVYARALRVSEAVQLNREGLTERPV
ncbi:MAG: LamG-like jellyroll fold domain-containing protein [Anaerolineae bacterium]